MVRKTNVKNKISESFDLPKEIILDVPNLKIIGDGEVTIENHKGIVEYSKDTLRMNSAIGIIKLSGADLQIKQISQDDICISGLINSIEFIK
jgi:sporulation protein YqfC